MSDLVIKGVTPQALPGVYSQYEHFIAMAINKDIESKLTLGGLYQACLDGESMAIEIRKAEKLMGVAIVCFTDIRYGKHLFVQALGGTCMDRWLPDFVDYLVTVARGNGCVDGILFCGRPGWQKSLRGLGFESVLVTMRKELIG